MSISIVLDDQPDFFTSLDTISGRIVLNLSRPENITAITVKLQGEATTWAALPGSPYDQRMHNPHLPPFPGGLNPGLVSESHKILYNTQEVYRDEGKGGRRPSAFSSGSSSSAMDMAMYPSIVMTQPGRHEYPFRFKLPFNNACSNPMSMAKQGLGGVGGGHTRFGLGSLRVRDNTKQLLLKHSSNVLPPSLSGFPEKAEIFYYIKVTIQRPGLLKENWRQQIGFRFIPVEPFRPQPTAQEAYARRHFTFKPKAVSTTANTGGGGVAAFFGSWGKSSQEKAESQEPEHPPPSLQISARLPHPVILTCKQPLPMRIIAKKVVDSPAQVFLTDLQVDLIGTTHMRTYDIQNREFSRWVIMTRTDLSIPLTVSPDAAVESFVEVPDEIWRDVTLPNGILPTFTTCNMSRSYQLEVKIGVVWGPAGATSAPSKKSSSNAAQIQRLSLPLNFADVAVFSGITAPAQDIIDAMASSKNSEAGLNHRPQQSGKTSGRQDSIISNGPPLPPRPSSQSLRDQYTDAPPSYDEAMSQMRTGPQTGSTPPPPVTEMNSSRAPISQEPLTEESEDQGAAASIQDGLDRDRPTSRGNTDNGFKPEKS